MNISRRTLIRALGALPGVSLSGVSVGQMIASKSNDVAQERPVLTGSTRVPVEDPHITLGHGVSYTYGTEDGIPDLARSEFATEILKLHPDFWNQRYITGMNGDPFLSDRSVPQAARDGIDLAASLELPASLGFAWMPRDVPLDERPAERQLSGYLTDLPPEEQWPAPDGSQADNQLHASTSRSVWGDVKKYTKIGNTYAYSVSMYASGPVEYHLSNNKKAPLYGANATEMDLAVSPSNLLSGDFSVWAIQAFRRYLDEIPAERLDRLNIQDVSDFNIRSYAQNLIESVNTGSQSKNVAVTDPVLFEFYLMEHQRLLDVYESYVRKGKQGASQVDSPLTTLGNQGWNIASPQSNGGIIVSQVFDLVEMEGPITIPDQEADVENIYQPPIRTTTHKRAAAIKKKLGKPVVEHGFYGTGGWGGALDPTDRYPTLQTLNFAEVYANGSTRQLDLDGWNGRSPDDVSLMWLDPESGSVPDDLRPLADFLWTHKRDLNGSPVSDVAIVYSIPTYLAKIRPFVGRWGVPESKVIDGWVTAARECQIPSELIIFGHPDLWDDSSTLDRLSDYQTLVLPGVTALTDAQAHGLREFVNEGGTVIFEGEIGTHDGYYRPRTDNLSELDGVIEAGDAGMQASNGDSSAAGDIIEDTLQSPIVRVDGPSTLSAEVIETDDGWKNVHLVNYDYDSGSDSVADVSNVSVSLLDAQSTVHEVDVISPDSSHQALTTQRNGEYISVTVPEISVWSIVRFKTGTRTSEATKSEAEESITDASNALEEISDTGRSLPVTRGEAAVYEARLAKDAGQYDRALEKAEDAIEETKPAKKELHIGIDSSHGQDLDQNYDGLAEFRDKYESKYEISFSEITEITPEQLAGLDGFLIGPAFEWKVQTYDYSGKELGVLDRFVESGGRIAVVVAAGVDDSINTLTERFGITVDSRQLQTKDMGDNVIRTEPAQYRTPITYQVLQEGWSPRACSLTDLGENVSIQIQSSQNTVREGSSETKQFPICAIGRKGDGAVVVHTSDKLLSELQYNFEVQARNILRFIGDTETDIGVNDLKHNSTEPSASSTRNGSGGASGSQSERTTRTSGPGFGQLSAIAGLLSSLIYFVHKNLSREE